LGESADPARIPRLAGPLAGRFRSDWRPALVTALVALATFAVTLGGTFIYDDLPVILEDPRMGSASLWYSFWTDGYRIGGVDRLYRPLTSLSFAVQRWLHGDVAWPLHGVNVLLHAGATAAVAEFTRRVWDSRAAWVAGLLFAVHPVHTEAVAWLVGRAETLCTLATFCGLCLLLRRPLTAPRVLAVLGCYLAALLSKEQGILFPFLVLALLGLRALLKAGVLPGGPLTAIEHERLKLLGAVLLLTLAGYFLTREATVSMAWDPSRLDWSMQPMIRSSGADRWLMPFVLFGRYLLLLVAPAGLSIEYGGDVIGSSVRYDEPYFYVGVDGVLLWTAGVVLALRRRSWRVAFCLLGFGLTYGVVANFATLIGTIFGERLLYMPSAFLLAAAGAGVWRFGLPRGVVVGALALLTAAWAVRSFTYARQWNHRLEFYRESLWSQPKSVRLHELLFSEYRGREEWDAARGVAERCVRQVPHAYEGYLLLGEAAAEQGDLASARSALFAAFERGAGDESRRLAGIITQREDDLRPPPD
jgi:protein O-mannosyl-transferase